jgi:uncharacterized membrane protein
MTDGLETIARGNASRVVQPRHVVARSAAEWRALWAAHHGPDATEPPVDFSTRVVAGAFAGERPTSGFALTITSARRQGNALVLTVEEQQPPAGAITAQMITSPFHLVSLPRFDGDIQFDARATNPESRVPNSEARFASPESRGPSPESRAAAADRRKHGFSPSSTGLTPPVAGALAYLAGPFSGALLIGVERSSRFVKFHAWQALVGLGLLGFAAALFLLLAFLMLLISPAGFWTMLWFAAVTAAVWVVVWAICLVQAYRGRLWKLPLAGHYAERRAGLGR